MGMFVSFVNILKKIINKDIPIIGIYIYIIIVLQKPGAYIINDNVMCYS